MLFPFPDFSILISIPFLFQKFSIFIFISFPCSDFFMLISISFPEYSIFLSFSSYSSSFSSSFFIFRSSFFIKMMNSVHLPSSLSARMCPPCASTTCRTKFNPSPKPCAGALLSAEARSYLLKMVRRCRREMPRPLSRMRSSVSWRPAGRVLTCISTASALGGC